MTPQESAQQLRRVGWRGDITIDERTTSHVEGGFSTTVWVTTSQFARQGATLWIATIKAVQAVREWQAENSANSPLFGQFSDDELARESDKRSEALARGWPDKSL